MSEEQKPQRPQSDFFSDLMFGRAPMPPDQPANQSDTTGNEEELNSPEAKSSQGNKQPDQLESIFALVESLGPVISKLGPLAATISSYFSQKKNDEDKKKNLKE
jgi:hypothetical protein